MNSSTHLSNLSVLEVNEPYALSKTLTFIGILGIWGGGGLLLWWTGDPVNDQFPTNGIRKEGTEIDREYAFSFEPLSLVPQIAPKWLTLFRGSQGKSSDVENPRSKL